MRQVRHTTFIALAAIGALLIPQSAEAGVLTPTTVRATERNEYGGTGNADYFAWTQDRRHLPRAADVWARPTGGSAWQVDGGTNNLSWSGQIDQTGALLAWQTRHRYESSVRLMDLSTHTSVPLPDGVNTTRWEAYPSVFGNEFTFVRYSRSATTLFLTALDTGAKTVVASLPYKLDFISTPRVYGNWVVYETYNWRTGRRWKVYRYDITNDTTEQIPSQPGLFDYAGSVDVAGNVYFARSGNGCGLQVRLYVWDGTNTALFYSVPGKNDTDDTSVYDDGLGNVTVYASVADCTTKFYKADIVSFANPASVLPLAPTSTPSRRTGSGRKFVPMDHRASERFRVAS